MSDLITQTLNKDVMDHRDKIYRELLDMTAERDALREAQRWIPVGERLPEIIYEEDGSVNSVLVFAKDGYECGSDIQIANAAWMTGEYRYPEITDWMPLPAPPPQEQKQ